LTEKLPADQQEAWMCSAKSGAA